MKTSLKLGISAAALAVAGLVAVPFATALSPAAPVPAATPGGPTTGSTCTTAQHLAWMYRALPPSLRSDLEAATRLPAGPERTAALQAVLDKAAKGSYGDRIEKRATRIERRDGRLWQRLPADLRTDLLAVMNADPGQATLDAAAKVYDTAAGGGYGDVAKKVAARIAGTKPWTSCRVR
ncbi:MAG TPA: hypothetical protein VFK68_09375 [Propionibacteriaceae bacterium]|nr:hypothetical protein [Propionibacteriaceae bacterium]